MSVTESTTVDSNCQEESKAATTTDDRVNQVIASAKKSLSAVEEIDAKIAAFKAKCDEMTRVFVANMFGGGFKEAEEYKNRP